MKDTAKTILCVTAVSALIGALLFIGGTTYKAAEAEKAASSPAYAISQQDEQKYFYTIVVDEETLIQYIRVTNGTGNCRIMGLSVRMKPDGTPYTINRKDLDKYEHFSFANEVS